MVRKIKEWIKNRIEILKHEVTGEIKQEIRNSSSMYDAHIDCVEKKVDSCYQRIEIVEQNLNYYNMIRDIQREYDYVNLELLRFRKTNDYNILLVGFYGADNLGDELMLQSIFSIFSEKKGVGITVMLCDNCQYDYTHFPDVDIIHYPKSILDYNVLAQQYDCLIWGGGALIDDTQYDMKKANELGNMLVDLSKRFIVFGKKTMFLGLSSNKCILNKQYISGLKYIIENSTFFSVRDFYTREVLIKLGVSTEKIQFINDLIFAHPIWRKTKKKKQSDIKNIGIVFLTIENHRARLKDMLKGIHEICVAMYGTQFEIRCIPFYNYNQQDVKFYDSIIHEFNNIVVCQYKNDINDILSEFEKLDFIVSMRYHATVISKILEIPSLTICLNEHPHYYNKMKAITEMTNDANSLINFEDIDENNFSDIVKEKMSNDSGSFKSNLLYETEMTLRKIMELSFDGGD